MRYRRSAVPLLFAAALAWPAFAQQPAAAPVAAAPAMPSVRGDCDQLDAMRSAADAQRVSSQALYETALALYSVAVDRGDSVSTANYRRGLAEYNAAYKAYQSASMKLLQAEVRCMPAPPPRPQTRGWIGITFSGDITMVRQSGKDVMMFKEYPMIESVEWGSPAQKARVKQGDVLLSIDGADLTKGSAPFSQILLPGKKLDLQLKRGASTVNCVLTVERRPDSWAPMAPPAPRAGEAPEPPEAPDAESWAPRMPQIPRVVVTPGPDAGSMTMTISYDEMTLAGAHVQTFPALKQYFGVDSGLLVISVVSGTPASDAGLQEGDVIVAAAGKPVTTPSQLASALRSARARSSLTLDIVRKRKKQAVELKW